MKDEAETAVKALLEKAKEVRTGHDAMQYTQAAVNAARVWEIFTLAEVNQ